MVKFPYVEDYSLFDRIDIRAAEELLRDYNDFYLYNQSQYNDIFKKDDPGDVEVTTEDSEVSAEMRRAQAEQNAKVAVDSFARLFGSKDFAESAMVGLRISWEDLQQILLGEFKSKTSVEHSATTHIAYSMRNLASLLLFAERIAYGVGRLKKNPAGAKKPADIEKVTEHNRRVEEADTKIRNGFVALLAGVSRNEVILPEYNKTKKDVAKLKTVDGYTDFCEKVLLMKL